MPASNLAHDMIAPRFDRAAAIYDEAAPVQEQIAARLVDRAARTAKTPAAILDIGCGTGFASMAAARFWPRAQITALDKAPAMLREIGRKLPAVRLIEGDATTLRLMPQFNLALSSMALHWFANPRDVLAHWRGWLKPGGVLHAALLIDGSFNAWRELCVKSGVADGLWPLPPADFADDLAPLSERETITADYPSAQKFLRRLKTIGAATPRPGYKPLTSPLLRHVLSRTPRPFSVGYEVLYLTIGS
jgi:malonyl-CoA O-methyltransferase